MGQRMTDFGLTVWRLMAARGITTQRDLARAVENATGEALSFDTVRNYLYGRSVVHPSFTRQLVAALGLTEEEKRDLADAFAWGQGDHDRPRPAAAKAR